MSPEETPDIETRLAQLETVVFHQTWFIAELQRILKSLIAQQAIEKARPQLEARLRAQIAAGLSQGFNPADVATRG